MKFTFGIITNTSSFDVTQQIRTIRELKIPEYEILVVGDICNVGYAKVIRFDESIKKNWITRKKNIITENANYENIVYSHDYVTFDKDWYNGWLKFGPDFKVASNKILDTRGKRFRDWLTEETFGGKGSLLPYELNASPVMYISGTYWVAKKQVMEEFPLDERLCWGESEDIEWSHRVREKYDFSMNKYSTVVLRKEKQSSATNSDSTVINALTKLSREDLKELAKKNHNHHVPEWIRNKLI